MVKRNLMKYLNAMIGFAPAPHLTHGKFLGTYFAGSSPILITDEGLQLVKGNRRKVLFGDIRSCSLIGSKEDVRGLKVELCDGKEITLSGFPTNGKFDDVFAFMQFLKHASRQGSVIQRQPSRSTLVASAAT